MIGGICMRVRTMVRLSLIGGTLALAACQNLDPYTREGTWQPTGANQGNLAAMVANPYDLIHGRGGQSAPDSKEPTLAINRIWTDTPKALPDPGGPSAGGGSSGGGSGGGSGSGGSAGSSGGSGSGGS